MPWRTRRIASTGRREYVNLEERTIHSNTVEGNFIISSAA